MFLIILIFILSFISICHFNILTTQSVQKEFSKKCHFLLRSKTKGYNFSPVTFEPETQTLSKLDMCTTGQDELCVPREFLPRAISEKMAEQKNH